MSFFVKLSRKKPAFYFISVVCTVLFRRPFLILKKYDYIYTTYTLYMLHLLILTLQGLWRLLWWWCEPLWDQCGGRWPGCPAMALCLGSDLRNTHELIYILFTIFFSHFTPKNSDCQSTKEASYCLNFCDLGRWWEKTPGVGSQHGRCYCLSGEAWLLINY